MSCDARKWECLYCTFLNWQSAIKCTMCRSPKPLEVIEEGAPPPISSSMPFDEPAINPNQTPPQERYYYHYKSSVPQHESSSKIETGIASTPEHVGGSSVHTPHFSQLASREINEVAQNYLSKKLQDTISGAKLTQPEVSSGDTTVQQQCQNRWTCPTCCTLNWINVSSCKQCNTKLNPQCFKSSKDYEHEAYISKDQETLKISELTDSGNYRESSKRPNSTPMASPTKVNTVPQGAEKFVSRSNSPNNSNANQEKWTCPVCTYDNWPRSFKCIMCTCPRYDQATGLVANEVMNASLYSQTNVCVDSVMTPALANLSLGVSNNRGPNFETSHYEENAVNTNYTDAMRMRMFRGTETDRRWLDACCGAVDGNIQAVEEYISTGGDPTRQLTEAEVLFLDRPSAFDIGFTLIHLALRFKNEDVLATLLSQVGDGGPPIVKRVPSYAAPNVAMEIRRHAMGSIRPRKGIIRCHYTTEIVTFTLPSEIDDMTPETQETLFDEILDRDVQKELENGQIINWSLEVAEQLNSRLHALWNRSAGDCLLDSVLQATWGIFDRDNGLRRALSDSLHDCATQFYQRWKESELLHARHLNFSLNEAQCTTDWAKLLSLASQPGSSLEQLHIFALAHILRRPIIVYGVKYVKSFRGEAIGFARYEGVYLPFLWEPSFCWRWPIALGYTRGHFSALVPLEPDCDPLARVDSAAGAEDINERSIYLPLTTVEGALLPIQFLTQSEIGKEEFILGQWLDIAFTESGVMVARQRIQKRPLLVAQMVDEWLKHYRHLGQITAAPYIRQSTATCYSSEGESDND